MNWCVFLIVGLSPLLKLVVGPCYRLENISLATSDDDTEELNKKNDDENSVFSHPRFWSLL
jgi:hypothetical protein